MPDVRVCQYWCIFGIHIQSLHSPGKKNSCDEGPALTASGAARDGPRMLGDGLERSSGDAARSPRGYVVSICFVLFMFTVFVFL